MNVVIRLRHRGRNEFIALLFLFTILILSGCETKPLAKKISPIHTVEVNGHTIEVNGRSFKVELAQKEMEHIHGLSDRDSLNEGAGMLFIFEDVDFRHFWMKDMRFPLDIAFLNENGTLVDVKGHAQPCTPSDCIVLDSRAKAKYVLEVNAGDLDNARIGDTAKINIENLE